MGERLPFHSTEDQGFCMSVDELESLAERRGAEPVPLDSLMSRRVRNILLISSLYDSFTMQSDGRFTEVLFTEYLKLNLSYAPSVVRVSTLETATESLSSERFDLVISMLRVGSMTADRMARTLKARHPGIPFVVLATTPATTKSSVTRGFSRKLTTASSGRATPGCSSQL